MNPAYGYYDPRKTASQNIQLQDSLLSRSAKNLYLTSFDESLYRVDLVFTLRDQKDKDVDAQIAHYVFKMHQYRDPREQDGEVEH